MSECLFLMSKKLWVFQQSLIFLIAPIGAKFIQMAEDFDFDVEGVGPYVFGNDRNGFHVLNQLETKNIMRADSFDRLQFILRCFQHPAQCFEPGNGVLVDTPVYPPFLSAPTNQGRILQTARQQMTIPVLMEAQCSFFWGLLTRYGSGEIDG